MDYSSLTGTIIALDAETPDFADLEPLSQTPRETIVSTLSNWQLFGEDSRVFSDVNLLKERELEIYKRLWFYVQPETLVHDILWFDLFYLDIRNALRNQVTSQSSWDDIRQILDSVCPEWKYLESQFEAMFEELVKVDKTHLVQELALDQIKIRKLAKHYNRANEIIRGYVELLVDKYNSLLTARMSLAGRDPLVWRRFMVHKTDVLETDTEVFYSQESTHTIDLHLLGESNLADTSPWVIEHYFNRQLKLYSNQAIFTGEPELEVLRFISKIKSCFELTKLLLFAHKRPDRLVGYNYDLLMT